MRFLFVIFFFSITHGFERRMNYSKSPVCDTYNVTAYHLTAVGGNDSIHYLWDFSRRPTLFLAVTEVDDNLQINCEKFVAGEDHSFYFEKTPKYEFSLIFSALIEFNDFNDTGILTQFSPNISYDTKDFTWKPSGDLTGDSDGKFVSLSMRGNNFSDASAFLSGNLTIEMTAFGFESHDFDLPRLLHSPNSTQWKIILDNLSSNSGFNESRFALELILVSHDSWKSSSTILTRKNLDDEHSPGIFSMVDIMTPGAQNQKFRGAFLQWRPIIYTSKVPSIGNSSEIVTYNLTKVDNSNEILFQSVPFKYYGSDLKNLLKEQMVVSLGVAEDGFYKASNYSSWTFSINYGSPENEKFSLTIILIMCIGLGLPTLLILIGGGYMCARRIRRSKDELSLER